VTRSLAAAALCLAASPALSATLYELDVAQFRLCPGATVDGSCFFHDIDEAYVNQIYAQANIRVNFIGIGTITNFPFQYDSGEADAVAALPDFGNAIYGLFGGSLPPSTAFLAYTPDLYAMSGGSRNSDVIGLAYVDAPTAPFGIIQASGFSQQVTSITFAHELGHILGGIHEEAEQPSDLLWPSINPATAGAAGYLPSIAAGNVLAMQDSALLRIAAVPLGPALPLLAAGLGALAALRRWRGAPRAQAA
jgi:hypothetical protein